MSEPDFALRTTRAVIDGSVRPATIHVAAGRIAEVDLGARPAARPGAARVEAGDRVVLPGLVDSHVHVNDPGRAHWEGFETATRAAAAGGVTTLVDMPLNSIPATTTAAGLRAKVAAAEGRARVDFGLWGGVVPGNAGELGPLLDAGVLGFKCFLVPSGVDEFPDVKEAHLREALPILARRGAVLQAHAEVPGPIEAAAREAAARGGGDPRSYGFYLASRPRAAENEAIDLLIRLCRETGAAVHIVHVSSSDALGPLRAARRAGLPISTETCPHYLVFAAEDIADGATQWKCAPPIRERANRDRLWAGLLDGTLDGIVSDHSPCPPDMKRPGTGDFLRSWGGIASLEVGLSAIWTEARARSIGIEKVAQWMSAAPARLAGLDVRKGGIVAGRDADLVVFDPDAEWTVEPERLHHRHKVTPYAGMKLRGRVEATYLRGAKVFDHGQFPGAPGGEWLKRAPSAGIQAAGYRPGAGIQATGYRPSAGIDAAGYRA